MKVILGVTSVLFLVTSFLKEFLTCGNLKGREFLFSYPGFKVNNSKRKFYVYVSGQTGTNVSLFAQEDNNYESQTIGNTKCVVFTIPCSTTVRVHADKDVFPVVSVSRIKSPNAEAMPILPVTYLSNKYYIVTYARGKYKKGKSVMSLTTHKHVTQLKITLKLSRNCPSSDTLVTQLNSFETYELYCEGDITGTMIESSAPVAVVSGRGWANIPSNAHSQDDVMAMMMPVDMYGTEYVIHDMGKAPALYRVLAASDNTTVEWRTKRELLHQSDFLDIDTTGMGAACLHSDTPVLLVVFYRSGSSRPWRHHDHGDPFMAVVPSTNRYSSSYLIPDIPLPTGKRKKYRRYMSIVFKGDFFPDWNDITELGTIITTQNTSCSWCSISVVTVRISATDIKVINLKLSSDFGLFYFALGQRYGLAYSGNIISKSAGYTTSKISSSSAEYLGLPDGTMSTVGTLQTSANEQRTERRTSDIIPTTSDQMKATSEASTDAKRRSWTGETTYWAGSYKTSPSSLSSPFDIGNGASSSVQISSKLTTISPTADLTRSIIQSKTTSLPMSSVIQMSSAPSLIETSMIMIPISTITQSTGTSSISTTTSATFPTTLEPISTTRESNKAIISELLNRTERPFRTVMEKCTCFCKNKHRVNTLEETVQIKMKERIRSNLIVNTRTLTKAIIKRTCATDARPSAQQIGWFGIVLMIIPVLIVLGTDIMNFLIPLFNARQKPRL